MNEIEEHDLNTLECKFAIHTLSTRFKPNLTGEQLLKYYEERTLTEDQMMAMVKHLNESGQSYIKEHPEQCQKFLQDGRLDFKIDHNKMMKSNHDLKTTSEIIVDLIEIEY